MESKIMVLTTIFVLSSLAKGDNPSFTITVIPQTHVIRVGQPFVFKLNYKFEQPQTSPDNGQARKYFRHHAYLDIEHENGDFSTKGYKIFPSGLNLEDRLGLEYSKYFLCFYHRGENRFLFPIPGRYSVTVRGWRNRSEPLDINVEPASNLEQLAINLLSDPNDYFFLEQGEDAYPPEKRPERMSHLQQVVDRCGGTVLAKWAAARLGLEYFEEFHKKHPSFKDFKEQWEQGGIKEPLFSRASEYLAKGAGLPDEFPIREKILYQLSRTECIEGNYEKAFSLLDELSTKYPDGEYGKKAAGGKEELVELQELQERELGQSTKPPLGQSQRRIALPIVLTAVAVGIALIGLILVLKKRPSSRSK